MEKVFIINAPMVFRGVWTIVRPWLAERTVKKVSILGTDYYSTLSEVVDAENLPSFLGGQLDSPLPPFLYPDEDSRYDQVQVANRSSHVFSVSVPAGGASTGTFASWTRTSAFK